MAEPSRAPGKNPINGTEVIEMPARHRRISKGKILVAVAVIATAGAAAIAMPQANAAGTGPAGTETSARTIPGTAWAIDAQSGEMVVTADSAVQGDNWDRLMSSTRGKAVRVDRTPGVSPSSPTAVTPSSPAGHDARSDST